MQIEVKRKRREPVKVPFSKLKPGDVFFAHDPLDRSKWTTQGCYWMKVYGKSHYNAVGVGHGTMTTFDVLTSSVIPVHKCKFVVYVED